MDTELRISKGNKHVIYDSRIELINTILLLCDYPILTHFNKEYTTKVKDNFRSAKESDVIEFFQRKCKKGFSFSFPNILMLNYDITNKNLIENPSFDEVAFKRLEGKKGIDNYIEKVTQYLEEYNYLAFFNDNLEIYKRHLDYYKQIIFPIMEDVEELYQRDTLQYNVYLSLLLHPGGFGPTINKEVCALVGVMEDGYSLSKKAYSIQIDVIFHELSHPLIHPYVNQVYSSMPKKRLKYIHKKIDSNDVTLAKEWIEEVLIRALSKYYCNLKGADVVAYDLHDYPEATQLYHTIANEKISHIDLARCNDLVDKLFNILEK